MRKFLVLTLMALAACGADGEPLRPEAKGTVTLGNAGIQADGGVSVGLGRLAIGVGF